MYIHTSERVTRNRARLRAFVELVRLHPTRYAIKHVKGNHEATWLNHYYIIELVNIRTNQVEDNVFLVNPNNS